MGGVIWGGMVAPPTVCNAMGGPENGLAMGRRLVGLGCQAPLRWIKGSLTWGQPRGTSQFLASAQTDGGELCPLSGLEGRKLGMIRGAELGSAVLATAALPTTCSYGKQLLSSKDSSMGVLGIVLLGFV